jgi:myo-inositol-1(or 4)-monophosphatase
MPRADLSLRALEFARRTAVRAGDFLRRRFGGLLRVRFKDGRGNLVTDMDHASEEMIVSALRREFPDHAVVAEERGARGESPFRWYVDPLDGTTNYAHGFPIWAVTIAFEAHGRMEAGVTYGPVLGELFWARRGAGAFRNGLRLRASRETRLNRALLATGFAYRLRYRRENLRHFAAFCMKARAIRRAGAASLDLAWTAAGVFDGFWEMCLGPWDMAAGCLLLSEAGARISDFRGGPPDPFRGELVAANRTLHRRMLAVLKAASRSSER